MPLKEYDQIRLKPKYQGTLGHQDKIAQDAQRTPGKDEVAQYIVDNVLAEDRWPMNMTDLAEETGYSRQHCSNVLIEYFEGVSEDDIEQGPASTNGNENQVGGQSTTGAQHEELPETIWVESGGKHQKVTIDVPNDVENRDSYIRGYLDAKRS